MSNAPEAWDGISWSGSFDELMSGIEIEPDVWESSSAKYPWGRIYGGQVVAQALWAAGQTVDAAYLPHSLHAYFIRGGQSDRPIQFTVERTRDGRSFMTRHVIGRQDDKVMLEMTASFHTPEPHEPSAATATRPHGLPNDADALETDWNPFLLRTFVYGGEIPRPLGGFASWARFKKPVGPSPLMQACALAYVSDDVPTEAVMALHPDLHDFSFDEERPEDFGNRFMTASLDHAIWFHQIEAMDRWQLHSFNSEIVANGRGMSRGRVFNDEGSLLATVMQEIVIRTRPRARPV